MTGAQRRTLEAVKAGKCERKYTERGNTMHGAHAATSGKCRTSISGIAWTAKASLAKFWHAAR